MEPYPCQDNPQISTELPNLTACVKPWKRLKGFREIRVVFQSRDQTKALSPMKSFVLCGDTEQAGQEAGSHHCSVRHYRLSKCTGQELCRELQRQKHSDQPQACSGTSLPPWLHQFWSSSKHPQRRSHPSPLFPGLPALTFTGSLHLKHRGILAPQKTQRKSQPCITGGNGLSSWLGLNPNPSLQLLHF